MDVINATDQDFNIIYYLVQPNRRKLHSNQETQLIQVPPFPLIIEFLPALGFCVFCKKISCTNLTNRYNHQHNFDNFALTVNI
ncbi:MAG: hypothetical protein ACI9L6_000691 [Flavobacterium sp.]|jgi:hypothetical protein